MANSDREYYLRRATEEHQRAERASHANVAQAHATMAVRYQQLADGKRVELGIVRRG